MEEKGYLLTKQGHTMSQPLHSPSSVSSSDSSFCEINLRDPLKWRTIQRGSNQPVGRDRKDPSASSCALLVVSGPPFQGPSVMLNSSHSQLPEPSPVTGSATSSFVTLGKLFVPLDLHFLICDMDLLIIPHFLELLWEVCKVTCVKD